MAKSSVVFAALLLAASAAAAQPLEIKGVPFGAGPAALKKAGDLWCRTDRSGLHDQLCSFMDPRLRTYAGFFANKQDYEFFGNQLDAVTMKFEFEQYDGLQDAINARYGQGVCTGTHPRDCVWNVGEDSIIMFYRNYVLHLSLESGAGAKARAQRLERAEARSRKDM